MFTFFAEVAWNTNLDMGQVNQIGLLLWKNWLVQKRRKKEILFEILFPVVIALLLLVLRSFSKITHETEALVWEDFNVTKFPTHLKPPSSHVGFMGFMKWTVAFAPMTVGTSTIMKKFGNKANVYVQGKATFKVQEGWGGEGWDAGVGWRGGMD